MAEETGKATDVDDGPERGIEFIARLIEIATALVAIIILAGILTVVLKANQDNAIVSFFHDSARGLVRPFRDIFDLSDHRLMVAVNWAIGLVVYVVIGRVVAGLIRRAKPD